VAARRFISGERAVRGKLWCGGLGEPAIGHRMDLRDKTLDTVTMDGELMVRAGNQVLLSAHP